MIIRNDSNEGGKQSYDGNILYAKFWQRAQVVHVTMGVVGLLVCIVQFSFSKVYSLNAWYFMVAFKIGQMILEYWLEQKLVNNLMLAPIATGVNVTLFVASMGNDSFYTFLFSFFIDISVQMCERAYICKIEIVVTEILEDSYHKVYKFFKK